MNTDKLDGALLLIVEGLRRAQKKFPYWPTDVVHAAAIVVEEAGELLKAALEYTYEPSKSASGDVFKEAVQTGAMALRFIVCFSASAARRSPQKPDPTAG